MVLLGYNSIRTFERTEEHIAAVTLHPDFGPYTLTLEGCVSALLDSSKLLLNIFTSFHSERAVNHDRL